MNAVDNQYGEDEEVDDGEWPERRKEPVVHCQLKILEEFNHEEEGFLELLLMQQVGFSRASE